MDLFSRNFHEDPSAFLPHNYVDCSLVGLLVSLFGCCTCFERDRERGRERETKAEGEFLVEIFQGLDKTLMIFISRLPEVKKKKNTQK